MVRAVARCLPPRAGFKCKANPRHTWLVSANTCFWLAGGVCGNSKQHLVAYRLDPNQPNWTTSRACCLSPRNERKMSHPAQAWIREAFLQLSGYQVGWGLVGCCNHRSHGCDRWVGATPAASMHVPWTANAERYSAPVRCS